MARALPLVYDELHRLSLQMQRGRHASVHATSVVHEAFLKLSKAEQVAWGSRAHFLAIAAKAMREVLVDRARHRGAQKRGGDWEQVTLDGVSSERRVVDLVALTRALDDLEELDPRGADVAQMRLLGGMTINEIAEVTGQSVRTTERDWRTARAWLVTQLA